jgi:putative endonuclease
MGREQLQKGKLAEWLACGYLLLRGYSILSRNYRSRWGEIDIIARCREEICFIEVKKRSNAAYGAPAEHVRPAQQKKIIKTALHYIRAHYDKFPACRFDVFCLGPGSKIEHLQNAFGMN